MSVYIMKHLLVKFQCYSLISGTQELAISCIVKMITTDLPHSILCCILRESKPKTLLATDSEPPSASHGICSANRNAQVSFHDLNANFQDHDYKVNSQRKIKEVNHIQRQRPALDKKKGVT